MPRVPYDIIGHRFGRLIVHAYEGKSFWRCLCDCGRETTVKTDQLNSGRTRSCGCLHSDATRERSTTHGHGGRGRRTKTHGAWGNMIQRCTNPNVVKHRIYGGRGVTVCERWRKYENFLADMGEAPPGTSLDRIDTEGNYEPGNCRWLDQKGQQSNRRNNRLLTFNGETCTITEWARRTGISRQTITRRLDAGWTLQQMLDK